MNYESKKVRETMLQISQNEIYLPAIQRKFVWGPDRIEKLFDSIMRGYPIGTFLFWLVKNETRNEYTFYKFIQDYHERDRAWNEVAPKPELREQFIGVLDGQQRLNSMYVALQGSYAYRRKHGRVNDNAAFPQRFLYINLFYQPKQEDESDIAYQFSFLKKEEADIVDASQYWFRVKDALTWSDISTVFKVISEASQKHVDHASKFQSVAAPQLTLLWQRLCSDDVINYFSIHDQELDKVVDIFVRVNSAGVQLSKTDLLFSSIVAHWDEGRSSIEALIQALNAKGNKFTFDNDFVMRCCLVLTDLPILFKVNSFKKENIERIMTSWPTIKSALVAMVDLLVEWGFSGETLLTQNAVIPIAYFAFKEGKVAESKSALRQYLIRALLNQIFASKTDRVLGAIRDHLRKVVDVEKPPVETKPAEKTYVLKSTKAELTDLLQIKLPEDRTLVVSDKDIDEFIAESKGAYTFMLLSLLYPHLKFDQVTFHQDHIHPWSQFRTESLRTLKLTSEQITEWQDNGDRLPNLQLMEGKENNVKRATPFATWLGSLGAGKDHFVNCNFIPTETAAKDGQSKVSLEFADFKSFFEARSALLKQKLKAVLVP